jgi:hypothetical protein
MHPFATADVTGDAEWLRTNDGSQLFEARLEMSEPIQNPALVVALLAALGILTILRFIWYWFKVSFTYLAKPVKLKAKGINRGLITGPLLESVAHCFCSV